MPAFRMPRMASLRLSIMATAALALSGCISIGQDPPPALLTLTPTAQVAAGNGAGGEASAALEVREPAVPGSLSVTRVPVQVDPSTIAYLKDAVWVERPSQLFQQLLIATLRERTGRLVLDGNESRGAAQSVLRGTLREFGYDAPSGSVVVTFDAIRETGGKLETRRFTARVSGVAAEAGPVGIALNEAANKVALEVADWIGQ